jgi:nicotinic acid mononucleotide adenylyltransferase
LRKTNDKQQTIKDETQIFITDAVQLDVSSTAIRTDISSQNNQNWRNLVTSSVADYIEKYKLYQ